MLLMQALVQTITSNAVQRGLAVSGSSSSSNSTESSCVLHNQMNTAVHQTMVTHVGANAAVVLKTTVVSISC
jgi:hypothetical protein